MHVPSATINARLFSYALIVSAVLFLYPTITSAQVTEGPTGNTLNPGEAAIVNTTNEQLTANPTLSNNGIFGCLGQGARVANVGTTRAVGGVYVPVNDAAVTLNTGFLVYKECILDGMARKIAESGTAEIGTQAYRAYEQGQYGRPQYLQDFASEDRRRSLAIVTTIIQGPGVTSMCDAYRRPVQNALARGYLQRINNSTQATTCGLPGAAADQQAFYGGQNFTFDLLFAGVAPNGNAVNTYIEETSVIDSSIAYNLDGYRRMLDWGRGTFPRYNSDDPLSQRVVTPGFMIADAISQITGSGYRQLENANEIDHVVANLWGGLSARLISSGTGVPGLFVSTGNQLAYADAMVRETQAAVRAGAVNAAVVALSNTRGSEAAYLEAKQGTGTAVLNAIRKLRDYENQYWNLIIPAVQTHAQSNGNPTLVIATSTQFSDAEIDKPANNIRALGSTTAAEIAVSQATLRRIDELIAQVTNSGSSAAQQQALLEIDNMVANNQLHTAQDAQNAATQRTTETSRLNTLVDDPQTGIKVLWGDSQDVNIGWANINNAAVVERWFNAWRR